VEAAIDFAEEEIDVLSSDRALSERLGGGDATSCSALQASGRQGRLLTQGMTVVIAGRPNAGKSTLLNRLAGHDAAIVAPTPGTTRDVLRERIVLDGMPLHVLDTAGLREPDDAIEAEGIRRARAAIDRADRILFVVDAAGRQRKLG
jgi:tRNA modification GTPase